MITNFFSGMIGEVGAASDGGDGFDELRSSSAAAAVSESIGKPSPRNSDLARGGQRGRSPSICRMSAVQIVRADIVISRMMHGDGRDVSEIGKFASELIGSPVYGEREIIFAGDGEMNTEKLFGKKNRITRRRFAVGIAYNRGRRAFLKGEFRRRRKYRREARI